MRLPFFITNWVTIIRDYPEETPKYAKLTGLRIFHGICCIPIFIVAAPIMLLSATFGFLERVMNKITDGVTFFTQRLYSFSRLDRLDKYNDKEFRGIVDRCRAKRKEREAKGENDEVHS